MNLSKAPGGDLPQHVLHIVENLDVGAVEHWLVRMLDHASQRGHKLDWTFYCVLGRPGKLEAKALECGASVRHAPATLVRKAEFVGALRRELIRGQYDVLHCHHDLMSAVYLFASAGLNVERRIVHVHNADEVIPTSSALKRVLYREPLRKICLTMADKIVGISDHTLDTFLHGRPRRPGRDLVHYYGVDPTPYLVAKDTRTAFRASMGVSPSVPLLLFGGRVVPEKNPVFVVDVLAALRRFHPQATAVFAGAGRLEQAVLDRARELNVADGVHMLGWREDLPAIMAACDLFILPRPESPMEGFGLAVVEAQLAGMRMLLSRGIADDPLLPTAVCRRLELADGPDHWASAARDLLNSPPADSGMALAALRDSPMDMDAALQDLFGLYS